MANAFNLTAQINIRGPANVNKVVSGIQKQLNGLNANVNLGINRNTTKTLAAANKQLQAINVSLNKVAGSATKANASMAQFAKSANSLGGTGNVAAKINSASKATQQLGRNAKITFKDIKLARTEIEEFGRQSALAIRRFTAFASVTSVIYGVNNAINRALSDFVKFDRQLVRISQVSGQAVSNLKGLQGTIGDLATTIGVSSSSLAEISVTLTQAGFSVREVQKALKALALTDVAPTFNNLNQTVEGSIALLRQFSIGAGQLEASLGSINAVAARFAVESSDIIAAIQRAGGVFAAASRGVSEGTDALNEFIAVFTAVRATTREGAETIATGLRTIFTRLQRESTIEALKEFGVSLQDAQGKFVGAYKAVQLLSEGLGGLDPRDIRFSKIVEELGGFRQIGKVIPLIGQFATAQKALTVAQQGQGSLAESNAKAQAALAIQFARVREEFLRLVRDVAGTDSFKGLVSGALSLASALIKVADAVKGVVPIIGLLAAARGASAIAQFGKGFGSGIRRTQGFASGGTVPGSGNTDSVPAMLTPGEFVLRKSAVRSIGTEKLHKMNKFGSGDRVRDIAKTPGVSKQLQRSISTTKEQPFRTGVATNANDRFTADITYDSTSRQQIENYITKRFAKNKPAGQQFRSRIFGTDKRKKGDAFEEYLASQKTRAARTNKISETYPVDFHTGASYGEAKNVQTKLNENVFVDKLYRARVLDGSYRNRKDQSGSPPSSESGQNIDLGKLKVFYSKFAKGGSVQDTVPAMLTPGEFVINKKSAKAVGYGNLRKMNTRPQGFNKGGVVGYNTGGLAAMKGRGSTIDLGGFTAQLSGLESAFASMGAPVDQLTNAVMKNGKVSYSSYKSLIRQAKANIDLARSSAKTSEDLKKVAAMEKQLMAIRRKGAAQAKGGGGAAFAKALDPQNLFYFTAAAGGAAAGLEAFDTSVTSGAATFINTILGMVLAASTAVSTITALASTTLGLKVASIAAAMGLTGVGIALGPLTIAVGAVVGGLALLFAGFTAYSAAIQKSIQLEEERTQGALDKASDRAAKALEKLSKEASAVNFEEALRAASDQAGATDDRAAVVNRRFRTEQQSGDFGAGGGARYLREVGAYLTLGYVDSVADATRNNQKRVEDSAKQLADLYGKQLATQSSIATARFNEGFTLQDLSAASNRRAGGGSLTEEERINADIFDKLLKARLQADESYIASQLRAEEQGRSLTTAEKQVHEDRVRREMMAGDSAISLSSKTAQAAREQERLAQLSTRLGTAFEKLSNAVGQAINKVEYEAQARQNAISSMIASGTGEAAAPELPNLTANVLENPSAYNAAERESTRRNLATSLTPALGAEQAQSVSALAAFDPNIISRAIVDATDGATAGADISALSDDIGSNIAVELDKLRTQGVSEDVINSLQEQGQITANEIARRLEGVTDPTERRNIIEEETKKFNESLAKARDGAVKLATEFTRVRTDALNDFGKGLQEVNKLQREALQFEQSAINARRSSADSLGQALTGFGPSVSELSRRQRADTARLTGGPTDPAGIADNFRKLQAEAAFLRDELKKAGEAQDTTKAKELQERLAAVNYQLNNNHAALERLAESANAAAEAALNEVSERKRLQDANRSFAETLLTSGPDELKALDESLVRANQRVNGFIPQAGASERKKFFELLKSTGSVRQAQQGVAADMRKRDLQTLQQTRDVRIFRMMNQGMSREEATNRANQDEARILAQMGGEAGLGALGRSIVGQAVATTADPLNDPVMKALTDQYTAAAAVQAQANQELSNLTRELADGALKASIEQLSTTISDLNKDIVTAIGNSGADPNVDGIDPTRKSRGGLIYASNGQYINFKPKGTDTVPAMLTPGEFVVNRQATQKNMGLLQSINGGKVNTYSKGGKVAYLRGGGFAQRDTNKDGVLTVGVEDTQGLNDTNNDGIITFAEFVNAMSLSNPQNAAVASNNLNAYQQMSSLGTGSQLGSSGMELLGLDGGPEQNFLANLAAQMVGGPLLAGALNMPLGVQPLFDFQEFGGVGAFKEAPLFKKKAEQRRVFNLQRRRFLEQQKLADDRNKGIAARKDENRAKAIVRANPGMDIEAARQQVRDKNDMLVPDPDGALDGLGNVQQVRFGDLAPRQQRMHERNVAKEKELAEQEKENARLKAEQEAAARRVEQENQRKADKAKEEQRRREAKERRKVIEEGGTGTFRDLYTPDGQGGFRPLTEEEYRKKTIEAGDGNISFNEEKVIRDEGGRQIGTGKKFEVYDAQGNALATGDSGDLTFRVAFNRKIKDREHEERKQREYDPTGVNRIDLYDKDGKKIDFGSGEPLTDVRTQSVAQSLSGGRFGPKIKTYDKRGNEVDIRDDYNASQAIEIQRKKEERERNQERRELTDYEKLQSDLIPSNYKDAHIIDSFGRDESAYFNSMHVSEEDKNKRFKELQAMQQNRLDLIDTFLDRPGERMDEVQDAFNKDPKFKSILENELARRMKEAGQGSQTDISDQFGVERGQIFDDYIANREANNAYQLALYNDLVKNRFKDMEGRDFNPFDESTYITPSMTGDSALLDSPVIRQALGADKEISPELAASNAEKAAIAQMARDEKEYNDLREKFEQIKAEQGSQFTGALLRDMERMGTSTALSFLDLFDNLRHEDNKIRDTEEYIKLENRLYDIDNYKTPEFSPQDEARMRELQQKGIGNVTDLPGVMGPVAPDMIDSPDPIKYFAGVYGQQLYNLGGNATNALSNALMDNAVFGSVDFEERARQQKMFEETMGGDPLLMSPEERIRRQQKFADDITALQSRIAEPFAYAAYAGGGAMDIVAPLLEGEGLGMSDPKFRDDFYDATMGALAAAQDGKERNILGEDLVNLGKELERVNAEANKGNYGPNSNAVADAIMLMTDAIPVSKVGDSLKRLNPNMGTLPSPGKLIPDLGIISVDPKGIRAEILAGRRARYEEAVQAILEERRLANESLDYLNSDQFLTDLVEQAGNTTAIRPDGTPAGFGMPGQPGVNLDSYPSIPSVKPKPGTAANPRQLSPQDKAAVDDYLRSTRTPVVGNQGMPDDLLNDLGADFQNIQNNIPTGPDISLPGINSIDDLPSATTATTKDIRAASINMDDPEAVEQFLAYHKNYLDTMLQGANDPLYNLDNISKKDLVNIIANAQDRSSSVQSTFIKDRIADINMSRNASGTTAAVPDAIRSQRPRGDLQIGQGQGPADDTLQRISRGEGHMDGGKFVPGKPPVDAGPAAPLQSSLTSEDRGAQAKQILKNTTAASRTEAETAIVNQAIKDPDILKTMRKGGMVYASNGMLVPYRPQGTDTVPAMLTPGEFVVNRNATSQYLPVLRAINSGYNTHGQMVNHLARGRVAGSPQYLQNGGLTGLAGSIMNNGVSVNSQIGGLEELKIVVNQLNEAISSGTENMTSVATQISNTSQSLASGAQSLNEAGTNIPTQITQQQRLTVDHAGIPQNIGAEFGRAADYAIGQADSRSAQQLNDLNTANEGSLGLPPPNNNSTIR